MSETGDPPHGTRSSKASLPQNTISSHDDEKIDEQHSCGPTLMTTQSEDTPSRTKRRRQPESAISPADRRPRKRMRPAPGHARSLEEGHEGHADPSRGGAESSDLSDGSHEFDDDDEDDEDEDGSREFATHPSRRTGIETSSASANISQPGQKPKRTRQLTTPYQSQVLHELLAVSRFPTTQMREEVGRKIGLSARKVQVWFQNQRQKAKKSEKEAAAARHEAHYPPLLDQYPAPSSRGGHAPTAAQGAPIPQNISDRPSSVRRSNTRPFGDSGPISRPESTGHSLPPHSYYHGHPGTGLQPIQHSFEGSPSSRLTGPGVPGTGAGINPYEPAPRGARLSSPPLPPSAYHRPMSPGTSFHSRDPGDSYRAGGAHQPQPVQLAPLRIDTRNPGEPHSRRDSVVTSPSSIRTTESPVLPFPRHYSGGIRHHAEQSPRSPANIPPPFTLEPNPVWSSPHAPLGPPSTLGTSPGHSTFRGSSGRSSTDVNLPRAGRPPSTMQPPSRFDPVRSQGSSDPPHGSTSRRSYSRSPEDT